MPPVSLRRAGELPKQIMKKLLGRKLLWEREFQERDYDLGCYRVSRTDGEKI